MNILFYVHAMEADETLVYLKKDRKRKDERANEQKSLSAFCLASTMERGSVFFLSLHLCLSLIQESEQERYQVCAQRRCNKNSNNSRQRRGKSQGIAQSALVAVRCEDPIHSHSSSSSSSSLLVVAEVH